MYLWECILRVGSANVFVTCTTCVCVCTYICMHKRRYLCILLHNIIHKFSRPTHLRDEGAQHVCKCAAILLLGCENVLAFFCMLIYMNSHTLHTCRVMKVHDVCVWCTSRCRMLQPPPCSRRYWTSCWRYVMGSSITKRATRIANVAPRTGNHSQLSALFVFKFFCQFIIFLFIIVW